VAAVREARSGDFDAVLRLYLQLNLDDPRPDPEAAHAQFEEILARPGLHLLVLELDHAIVATTYLNVIPNLTRALAPYAVIENVLVEERLRGRGLGKQLMAATLQMAWDAGCYKAMLMTGSRTPATHAFYRSCGFSPDAKQAYLARRPADA
jgi:GNAT superfamily N-acetyltransferase